MDVIIPSYNPDEKLVKTVDSLSEDIVDRVILVDDHSSEVKYIREVSKRDYVDLYRNKRNVGQGLSRNLGFSKSTSDKVMFLDDDVVILEKSLKEINDLLDSNDAVIYTYGDHLSVIDGKHFVNVGNFFAFDSKKFEELGGFIKFRRREDLDLIMRSIERGFKIIGYSEGVKHLSDHNPHKFYDWLTNIIFNVVYFDVPCMRFRFFYKPLRFMKILKNYK